jgi:ligand-binding SRPBCC domain-containing protein
LQIFKHTFTVNTPINKAWEFYTDINHLKVITPKEVSLKVVNTTSQKFTQGTEIWIEGRMMIYYKRTWHSVISFLKPYQYIDEMISGPFKTWRHLHRFYYDVNFKKTQVIDEVEFELPYGVLGRVFEGYAYNQLKKIFDYRKKATIRALEIT